MSAGVWNECLSSSRIAYTIWECIGARSVDFDSALTNDFLKAVPFRLVFLKIREFADIGHCLSSNIGGRYFKQRTDGFYTRIQVS